MKTTPTMMKRKVKFMSASSLLAAALALACPAGQLEGVNLLHLSHVHRADQWFRDAMAKLREKEFKYISAISIHSYYDPSDPLDPFVPSTAVLKEMVDEFHAHGIAVCSIPFQGGETEEVYFKLFDLGFDGFSTDYPSVMFSVIRQLKERAKASSPNHDIWHDDVK